MGAVGVAVGGELAVGAATRAVPALGTLASAVGAKISSAFSWLRDRLSPTASAAEQQIAANSRTQIARTLGNAGESASGLAKNTTRIPSLTGTANYRIPDGLTNTTLSEVKNESSLSYTSQLRDFAAYSQQQGLNFELYTRSTTQLTGPLQEAIEMGDILLRYLP